MARVLNKKARRKHFSKNNDYISHKELEGETDFLILAFSILK